MGNDDSGLIALLGLYVLSLKIPTLPTIPTVDDVVEKVGDVIAPGRTPEEIEEDNVKKCDELNQQRDDEIQLSRTTCENQGNTYTFELTPDSCSGYRASCQRPCPSAYVRDTTDCNILESNCCFLEVGSPDSCEAPLITDPDTGLCVPQTVKEPCSPERIQQGCSENDAYQCECPEAPAPIVPGETCENTVRAPNEPPCFIDQNGECNCPPAIGPIPPTPPQTSPVIPVIEQPPQDEPPFYDKEPVYVPPTSPPPIFQPPHQGIYE